MYTQLAAGFRVNVSGRFGSVGFVLVAETPPSQHALRTRHLQVAPKPGKKVHNSVQAQSGQHQSELKLVQKKKWPGQKIIIIKKVGEGRLVGWLVTRPPSSQLLECNQ